MENATADHIRLRKGGIFEAVAGAQVFAAGDCTSVMHNVIIAKRARVSAGFGASLRIRAVALNRHGIVQIFEVLQVKSRTTE